MGEYGNLHLGRIISYDEESGGYFLKSVSLARGSRWGPVESCVPGLLVDDRVVLGATGTTRDDLKILAKVGAAYPDIVDIPGLVAALAAKADDTEITAINAELVVQDGRLDADDILLASHTSTLSSHTGTLSSHTSTLTNHEGRIVTQEAKVGYVLPVANGAARPVTGLYNGYPVYRQDKAFMEFYNGAGSWRLRQFSLVGALADVDYPVGGQVVVLATDLMMYRYDAGLAGWLAFQHTVPGGGHARYLVASGHANIPASTVTKVAFNTAESTTTDVTQSVDKKDFTLVRGGKWFLACKLPYSGGTPGGASRFAWIAPSSNNAIRYAGGSTPPSNYIMVPGGSDTVQLPANTSVSVYAYQDAATSLGFDITALQGSFTAEWRGP